LRITLKLKARGNNYIKTERWKNGEKEDSERECMAWRMDRWKDW